MPDHDDSAAEVLCEQRDSVLVLKLNRPERLNAWTPAMQLRYTDLLDRADRDPQIRAVVVTGAGRGFCAGADLAALADRTPEGNHDSPLPLPPRIRTPTVAAINGPAAGIGLIVALLADVRVASAKATLTTAFSQRSLIAEDGPSRILPQLAETCTALDLLLSATTLSAREAHELGVVDRVLPHAEMLDSALACARELATEASPPAVPGSAGEPASARATTATRPPPKPTSA